MSYAAVDLAFDHGRQHKLTNGEKVILIYLAHRANKNLTCWPSVSRIASDNGTTKRSVLRSISKFCRLGIIRKQAHGGAAKRLNEYVFGDTAVTQPGDTGVTIGGHRGHFTADHSYYMNITKNKGAQQQQSLHSGDTDMGILKTSGKKARPKKDPYTCAEVAEEISSEVTGLSLDDVVASYKAIPGGHTEAQTQGTFWRHAFAARFGYDGNKVITGKAHGHLSHIFAAYGTQAFDYIGIIMDKWDSAGQYVKNTDKTVKWVPPKPTIGFLDRNKEYFRVWVEEHAQLIAQKTQMLDNKDIDKSSEEKFNPDEFTMEDVYSL